MQNYSTSQGRNAAHASSPPKPSPHEQQQMRQPAYPMGQGLIARAMQKKGG